jgi:hypothetical protein
VTVNGLAVAPSPGDKSAVALSVHVPAPAALATDGHNEKPNAATNGAQQLTITLLTRQAHVQQAEADFDPLPFDAAAARAFGRVAASLRPAGRKTAARAYDAMIAATAIANELPLYTCNPSDFAGIDGLAVVPVPHPPAPEP